MKFPTTTTLLTLLLLASSASSFAPSIQYIGHFPPLLLPSSRYRGTRSHVLPACTINSEEEKWSLFGGTQSPWSIIQERCASVCTSVTLAIAILTTPISISVQINSHTNTPFNIAHHQIISIQKSAAQAALTENQQFVADVWFAVTAQYFDKTFNHLGEEGWRQKEKEAIQAVADTGPEDEELVTQSIQTMLSALGDPYTRFLPREKYEALTNYATGGTKSNSAENAGIGVQLLEDPRTKYVTVMATSAGGPAAEAGVQIGDIIWEVDGEPMEGATADIVAAKCRGAPGEAVDVIFLRRDDDNSKEYKQQKTLTRRKLQQVNPIATSTFVSSGGKTVGVIRIPSFSTETAGQLVEGLRSLTAQNDNQKVDAIAIDIRGNVGGFMPAGIDAAKLFLPARAHIIAEVDSAGNFKAYDADGIGAETTLPIYLVVDQRTASASEIFAAALQDNRRAVVVGTTNTFGKGRIQNVQALGNGSGVAVTRARYVTPRGRDLHGVGILPNKQPTKCESSDSVKTCLADIV